MTITINELIYTWLVDGLVLLNRTVLRKDMSEHDCDTEPVKCDMLERECGAPWSLLLAERRMSQLP